MTDTVYDMVILGAGSGGYAAALRGTQLGLTVALIEADKIGGTCLHRGCVPTKAILHSAETAEAVREAASVGVNAVFQGLDMPAVQKYKNGVVSRMRKGLGGARRSPGALRSCAAGAAWSPGTPSRSMGGDTGAGTSCSPPARSPRPSARRSPGRS